MIRNRRDKPAAVWSVSDGNEFNLGTLAPGADATWTAKSGGAVEVLTDAYSDPVAQIYVAPSAWVGRTRSDKGVTFSNVPPGRYRAVCWHARLPGSQSDVTLVADKTAHVNLKV